MNMVFLIGNLCADPELKLTKNGFSTCTVNLATNERRKGKDGEFTQHPVYHRIVLLGKQAENFVKYQKKGSKVAVVGRIDNRQYEDKDGNKRTISEVVAETVEYLSAKKATLGFEDGSEGPSDDPFVDPPF